MMNRLHGPADLNSSRSYQLQHCYIRMKLGEILYYYRIMNSGIVMQILVNNIWQCELCVLMGMKCERRHSSYIDSISITTE